ncbi:hypothetical protein ACRYCC_42975 [Actinomadura scrupuli]|uniref:hypothetical protein n=1 Tax=Actinomadura scrupuli TaxID=559629 RepID=UPI003D95FC5B
MFPSSYRFMAHVEGGIDRLTVTDEWARFFRAHSSDEERSWEPVWRQQPMEAPSPSAPPGQGEAPATQRRPVGDCDAGGSASTSNWLVVLFLVTAKRGGVDRGEAWVFQARMSASALGRKPLFLRRTVGTAGGDQAERRQLTVAHRIYPEFGIGHSVAVHVEQSRRPGARHPDLDRRRARHEVLTTDVPKGRHRPRPST